MHSCKKRKNQHRPIFLRNGTVVCMLCPKISTDWSAWSARFCNSGYMVFCRNLTVVKSVLCNISVAVNYSYRECPIDHKYVQSILSCLYLQHVQCLLYSTFSFLGLSRNKSSQRNEHKDIHAIKEFQRDSLRAANSQLNEFKASAVNDKKLSAKCRGEPSEKYI